ncbi:uncharacterized protein LOC118746344 [Rhagoletis pomonella]|uniref:uncharacterized protein LOC118746344 n=1 Tax=Rhagoletis pomonella TaxID=28610 RepID=UPI00177E8DC7|nr:uncharacterized protein LOC118746344 [Rhagoletis pomonella]
MLGVVHLRTTPYHPQSNGMIERWHRTLKAAIRCWPNNDWSSALPLVLLGMRTTVKTDINASPAEMLYGRPICIPGEFLHERKRRSGQAEFMEQLREAMSKLPMTKASRHDEAQTYIQPALKDCKFVFVRIDRVRQPLEPHYEGPYAVLSKQEKYFVIKVRQREVKISIDRLKAAFIFNHDVTATATATESYEGERSTQNTVDRNE